MSPNASRSAGWRWTTNRFGRERAIGGGQAFGLHRALDPALQLDGLEARTEQARGRTLEKAFEEPLDGGERRHGRSRSLAGGPGGAARTPRSPRTIRSTTEVPPAEGRESPCGILSALFERCARSTRPAHTRGPDAGDPYRIILRTVWHPLHVRIGCTSGRPPQGDQGRVARSQELRHVGRHVHGRGVRGGAQRDRPRGHVAAAGRLPQDLQLLHVVPPVHVRQLLEQGRGSLPVVRSASRRRTSCRHRSPISPPRAARCSRTAQRARGGRQRARGALAARHDGLADDGPLARCRGGSPGGAPRRRPRRQAPSGEPRPRQPQAVAEAARPAEAEAAGPGRDEAEAEAEARPRLEGRRRPKLRGSGPRPTRRRRRQPPGSTQRRSDRCRRGSGGQAPSGGRGRGGRDQAPDGVAAAPSWPPRAVSRPRQRRRRRPSRREAPGGGRSSRGVRGRRGRATGGGGSGRGGRGRTAAGRSRGSRRAEAAVRRRRPQHAPNSKPPRPGARRRPRQPQRRRPPDARPRPRPRQPQRQPRQRPPGSRRKPRRKRPDWPKRSRQPGSQQQPPLPPREAARAQEEAGAGERRRHRSIGRRRRAAAAAAADATTCCAAEAGQPPR